MTSLPGLATRALAAIVSPGGAGGRLSILIYHRVFARDDPLNAGHVTAAQFDAHMDALATHFNVLPLSDAVERLATRSLPPRAASVTFDDGYADNAEVALPILQRHRVPATFFVAAGYLDGTRMWNDTVIEAIRLLPGPDLQPPVDGLGVLPLGTTAERRAAIRAILGRLKYLPGAERESRVGELAARAGLAAQRLMMDADQVRALHAAGMGIGAHTLTHPILARTPEAEARREIVESGRVLADIVRAPVTLFAYPNGRPNDDYGSEHVRMVRAAGYRAAVSTAWGVATRTTDRFQLPRFTPWDRSPSKFALRLVRNGMNRRPQVVPAT